MKDIYIFLFILYVGSTSLCFSQATNNTISSSTATLPLTNANTVITNNSEEIIQNQPRKLNELPLPIRRTNNQETIINQEEYRENRATPTNTASPKK